ncbi:hypothetical protein ACOSQ3_031386 [Xanthoceras sorbifolium]
MFYPLAFSFGDGESEEGWTWFLRHLRDAYGNPANLVIVSVRHKSIAKAMSSVYPGVPHLVCYYNLKENLKNHCRGRKDIMELYAKAAYLYQVHSCNTSLTQIQNSHLSLFNMLVEAGVDRWARAYFPGQRYQMMTTNIAEALNNCIKRARRLPIIAALEFLRDMFQRWFYDQRERAVKNQTYLTTAASNHCKVMYDELLAF